MDTKVKTKIWDRDMKDGSANNNQKNKEWQKPTLEDVSEKIMAQPYIRFT
ncbi:MAG: hypothetical protein AB1765_13570 [Candidatus Hydrogenedentota bacterium]